MLKKNVKPRRATHTPGTYSLTHIIFKSLKQFSFLKLLTSCGGNVGIVTSEARNVNLCCVPFLNKDNLDETK